MEPEKPKRKPWPAEVKRLINERSNGVCEYPACEQEGRDIDHIVPVDLGGQSVIGNAQLLCRDHHAAKTRIDIKLIAKGRRIRKALAEKPESKMKSRGFSKRWRKKLNGKVEKRSEADVPSGY